MTKQLDTMASGFLNSLISDSLRKHNLMKGGNEQMETKSRYEVISELESQKRNLIREREGFDKVLLMKKKDLKDLQRDVEDKEEEIKDFEDSMEDSKKTITELINSVDDSLKRFANLQEKSKK